jgi:hypothetical protein
MEAGMLWFDNDPKTALTAKVQRAVDYYRQKYGNIPNLCLVHPSMLPSPHADTVEGRSGKVALRPNRLIRPSHFWIGMEEKN